MTNVHYDIGIIGGGLAGLCLAIQAADKGYKVLLIEKEHYPFHKVCGEYISLESWPFLESLGLPLTQLSLPIINSLTVSSPNGNFLKQDLPLGGFGISRYKLDNGLKSIALEKGVQIIENCKAEDVFFKETYFEIKTTSSTHYCKVCCGTFGKRSNLDSRWKRRFTQQKPSAINNFIGVKYHAKIPFPENEIALHNFKDGYCGISRIEDGLCCICYLTTAQNLRKCNNNIAQMEQSLLQINPFLKTIFNEAEMVYTSPVTIAQISFAKKTQVHNHILLIGDAAGMITPLCGNGMSMAMQGSKLAFEKINLFLSDKISRVQMEMDYTYDWKKLFSKRLKAGRYIQGFFGKKWMTNLFISILKRNKKISSQLIRLTHGKPF